MRTPKQSDYDAGNLAAARIIQSDPQKYPGVMQTWVALVIGKQGKGQQHPGTVRKGQQQSLFQEAA